MCSFRDAISRTYTDSAIAGKNILTDCKIWQSPLEITWSSPLLKGGSPRAGWVTTDQVLSISKDEDSTNSVATCFLVHHNGKSIYFISMEFLASQHTHGLSTEHCCQESGSLSFTPPVKYLYTLVWSPHTFSSAT